MAKVKKNHFAGNSLGRYLGRMQTAFLISRLKEIAREALGPLLPLVRSLRALPKRRRFEKRAAALNKTSGISVCYLTREFPNRPAYRTEIAHGGEVKLTFLAEHFPHSYPRANLLYTVSSVGDIGKAEIVRAAKKKGLKVVLNQNGVAFPAWHGKGWEATNAQHRAVYQQADFIIYQSEFCKLSAQEFLGESPVPSTILYNPVDLNLYQPVQKSNARNTGPVLLLGGNQYERYRFESAVQTLKETLLLLPKANLIVTGKLWGDDQLVSMEIAKRLIYDLGLDGYVEFLGTYSQESAPEIFHRADILLHTKYNDPSPNLISEALASGLPIVYSASGGVPELVGTDAGLGITVEQSWYKISQPDPKLMAQAILKVWENWHSFSEAARHRAAEQFSLDKFLQNHYEIFAKLLD